MKKLFLLMSVVCFILAACTPEDSLTEALMLGGSSQAPVFLNCRAVSEKSVEFEFSVPVKVTSIQFEPDVKITSVENGKTVRVQIEEVKEPGSLIHVDLLVEDESKNTVNVLAAFRSKNSRMPELTVNEVCPEYSSPRSEFIEFKALSAGNLGAMRVFILGDSKAAKQTVYEFLPVEVKKGEYITLHLRTLSADCKNEYGGDLAESGGADSCDTARDFWIPGSNKLLHKTSVIYVLDQDDGVLASLMLSETPDVSWQKDYFAEAAEFLFQKGAWSSADGKVCTPKDAVITAAATATRTICRDETTDSGNTAADWYVTVTSGSTPGKPNNSNHYQS